MMSRQQRPRHPLSREFRRGPHDRLDHDPDVVVGGAGRDLEQLPLTAREERGMPVDDGAEHAVP